MSKVKVLISVDWEGCDLLEKNLNRIQKFQKTWDAPIVHYLNPSYYTNPKTKNLDITKKINSILSKNDELGMHIHAPKHFVEKAGVGLRSQPTFSNSGDYNAGEEFGQEVMLHGYSQDEFSKLINYGRYVLENHGFSPIKSFRAGGWMCDYKMIEVLKEQDFLVESSASVPNLLNESGWEGENLQRYMELCWDDITIESSPYFLDSSQLLLEIPNNLGAIDYWKSSWFKELINRTLGQSEKKDVHYAIINSHQETASEHWDKLDEFIATLKAHTEVEFITNTSIYKDFIRAA